MDNSKKLCEEIVGIINQLMPGKIYFHQSNLSELPKTLDHIIGRATNEPQSSRQYAKLCYDINCNLSSANSAGAFKTTLISLLQKRFESSLMKGEFSHLIRRGTVRFVGEMFNYGFFSGKIIGYCMDKILETIISELNHPQHHQQHHQFEYLKVLLGVAGKKLNDDNPAKIVELMAKLENVVREQNRELDCETRKVIKEIFALPIADFEESPETTEGHEKVDLNPCKLPAAIRRGNLIIDSFDQLVEDLSCENLEIFIQAVKTMDSQDFVKLMHNKGAIDDSNLIAVFCKIIEIQDIFPNFQQDMILIFRDNLKFFNRNSNFFNDAERNFLLFQQGHLLKFTNEELDEMQLVLNKAEQLKGSFKFVGDLYSHDFMGPDVIIEFLHNLSSVPVVSNLSIECFISLFTSVATKLLENQKVILYVKDIVTMVLAAFKYCPKTPKTKLLKQSLLKKAQLFLNYNIDEMYAYDDSEIMFTSFESEWEPQLITKPLWD